MKKILINIPDQRNRGGVVQYYKTMNLETEAQIDYFNINNFEGQVFFRLLASYRRFVKRIKSYDVIVLNPSLDAKAFFRDGIFAFIAKQKNKKLIIFWHGWKESFEKLLFRSQFLRFFFTKTFLKADGLIMLGDIFHQKLIKLGYPPNLLSFKETMSVPEDWIVKFSLVEKLKSTRNSLNILFLSRIVKGKGVYTCIDLANLILKMFPQDSIIIHIAGDGSELVKMVRYAKDLGVSNIKFHGDVRGEKKYKLFFESDLFFFPSETEGFPNVIIEALFFGLPVISRPVGAIPEIIEHGKNGFLNNSRNAADFIQYMEPFIVDKSNLIRMSRTCHENAKLMYSFNLVKKRTIEFYKAF